MIVTFYTAVVKCTLLDVKINVIFFFTSMTSYTCKI